MSKVKFNDYCIQVESKLDRAIVAALEEVAGEIESQAKRNSRVDTSKTKNSFKHKVVDSEHTAYIGSDEENAIWEEFGTGEYALEGNGRKGGWFYEDEEGNGHFTHGKTPSRAFWHAYETMKEPAKKHIENLFKEL